MQVLLFTGRAGSGKSTAVQMLEQIVRARGQTLVRTSFAEPLRKVCAEIFPWVPDVHFYGTKTQKEAPIAGMPEGWTGRRILQHIGTEGVRTIHPEAWVRLLVHRIQLAKEHGFDYLTVDDVRYPNEAEAVRPYGKLYRVVRDDVGVTWHGAAHSSEAHIDELEVDGEIVNNGTLDDLYEQMHGLLGKDLGAQAAHGLSGDADQASGLVAR